jgi:hypothetical protein
LKKKKTRKEKGLNHFSARAIFKNVSGTGMAVIGFGNTIGIDVRGGRKGRRVGERPFHCYLSAAKGIFL